MTTKTDVVLPLLQTEPVKDLISRSGVLSSFAVKDLATVLTKILPDGLPVSAPKEVWVESILNCLSTLLAQYDTTVEVRLKDLQQQLEARGNSYRNKEADGKSLSAFALQADAPSLEVQFAEFRTAVWQELGVIHEWMFWLSKVILAPDSEPEESTARAHASED